MKHRLEKLLSGFDGNTSLFIKNLSDETIVEINGRQINQCASEAKIFILLAYAEMISRNKLNKTDSIKMREADKQIGYGVLKFENGDKYFTLDFLAYCMMSISDNTATNLLLNAIGGRETIISLLNKYNFTHTHIDGGVFESKWIQSSCYDLACALEILYNPKKFNFPEAAANYCREIMSHCIDDAGLMRHFPWSPFYKDIINNSELKKSLHQFVKISCIAKTGASPGIRSDIALVQDSQAAVIIAFQCFSQDMSPLNAANLNYEMAAKIGLIIYEAYFEEKNTL